MKQAAQSKTQNSSFLTGTNAEYIAHLYSQYLRNSANVDQSWREFFAGLNDSEVALLKELHGASWTPDENRVATRHFDNLGSGANVASSEGLRVVASGGVARPQAPAGNVSREDLQRAALDSVRALRLVHAYRARGHLLSDLDPLGMKEKVYHPELDPAHYGFAPSDYDRPIYLKDRKSVV
jgi:2-oxoglutarate dehydrogenase E1 component